MPIYNVEITLEFDADSAQAAAAATMDHLELARLDVSASGRIVAIDIIELDSSAPRISFYSEPTVAEQADPGH